MQQWYKCPNCGGQEASGINFCGNCGTQLSWTTEQQPPLPPASQYQSQTASENMLFECLNSFERREKSSTLIVKCQQALKAHLDPISEAIIRGILVSAHAMSKDLESAQMELLQARELIGKIGGLHGVELQAFINKQGNIEPGTLLDGKVDH